MNVLLDLIEYDTRRTFKQQARDVFNGPCPFCHSEGDIHSDRMVVWTKQNRFWCRRCHTKGNTVDYLIQTRHMSVAEAMKYLADEGAISESRIKTERKEIVQKPPNILDFIGLTKYSIEDVKLWSITGKERAEKYYTTWFSPRVIQENLIGYAETSSWKGFTIPHFWHENGKTYLKGIKIRRDDTRSPGWQPKYYAVAGSRFAGCYPDTLVSNPDGSRLAEPIDYLFIVEAEKDALFMNSIGYPTVAYAIESNWNRYLQTAMKNVIMPVIIADNDGGKGLNRALEIQECFKIKPPIITPKLSKQPSDIAEKYGTMAVHEWITSTKLGIEAIEV